VIVDVIVPVIVAALVNGVRPGKAGPQGKEVRRPS
jgi:hypothetical protein